MLKENFIYPQMKALSFEDAVTLISKDLFEAGYVKQEHREKLLERELEFPTGLDTGEIKVAIPHTDWDYVIQPTIAVATLANPVKVYNMDQSGELLDIDIIMMLIVSDPSKQITLLQSVINAIQDSEFLKQLKSFDNKTDIYHSLVEKLKI